MADPTPLLAPTALAAATVPAPAPGAYVVHYADTRTGRLLGTLPVADGASLSFSHGILGEASCSLEVGPHPRTRKLWEATPGGKTMWAVEWTREKTRRICAAGVVWPRRADADRFTLGGGSIHTMFGRRKLYTAENAAIIQNFDFTRSNLDIGSIMRALLSWSMGTPNGTLPIVLEAERAGTHTRTYLGYELPWIADLIDDLSKVVPGDGQPGTEFAYQPRLSPTDPNRVEFEFLTGTQAQPQLTRAVPAVVLDRTAPKQDRVGDIGVEDSASGMGDVAWAKGGGSERATVIRRANDPDPLSGWPRLEVEDTNNSEDGTRVQEYADRLQRATARPLRGVTVAVKASWWWEQGVRLGDVVRVVDPNHRVLGSLDVTSRLLGESGQVGSEWVDLTLADTISEDF